MEKIKIAKFTTKIVVGFGTGRVVAGIISNNVLPGGIVTKVAVYVTAAVIGSTATAATQAHADKMIDDVVDMWNNKIKPEIDSQ